MCEVQEYIENGLKVIRQSTNAFDLNSLLLKPIQRVLKYPLLLQELIKVEIKTLTNIIQIFDRYNFTIY